MACYTIEVKEASIMTKKKNFKIAIYAGAAVRKKPVAV